MLSLGQDVTQCTDERTEFRLIQDASCPQHRTLESLTLALWSQTAVDFCSTTNCASHLLLLFFFTALFIVELLYVTEEHLAHVGFPIISNAQNN